MNSTAQLFVTDEAMQTSNKIGFVHIGPIADHPWRAGRAISTHSQCHMVIAAES